MPGKIIVNCTTARYDDYSQSVAHRFQPTPDLRTSIKKQSLNPALPRRIKSDTRLSRIATLTSRFVSKKLVFIGVLL